MASMQACAEALATTITTHSGWKAFAYPMLDPPVPCVLIEPTRWPMQTMSRGTVDFGFKVLVISGNMRDEGAHAELMAAITPSGSTSIVDAIYEHPTLGTSATESVAASDATMSASVDVGGDQSYGRTSFSDGGPPLYWFASFGVTVLTGGT